MKSRNTKSTLVGLVVLGAAFAGVGCGSCKKPEPTAAAVPTTPPTAKKSAKVRAPDARQRPGEISTIVIHEPVLERDSMGNAIAEFEVWNSGTLEVSEIELRIGARNADGTVEIQATHTPVTWKSAHASVNRPMRAGERRRVAVPLTKVPQGGRDALVIEVASVAVLDAEPTAKE